MIVCASYYGGFVCKKCEAKPEVREEEDQADPLWDIKKAEQATPAYQNLVRLAKKMDTEEGKKAYFRAANHYTNGKLSKLLKNGVKAIREMYAMNIAPAEIAAFMRIEVQEVQEVIDGNGRRCGESERFYS